MIQLPPHPSALFGSLRGVGYPVSASIADLIDNSISAGAREVRISFIWQGNTSKIIIADDGAGMKSEALIEAMRLGCSGPSALRHGQDLGRFGMGLKTASLAHCRRLTVVSKNANARLATARWDLAEIARHGEWRLETELSQEGNPEWQWLANRSQGTLVIWDDLDRLVTSDCQSTDLRIKEGFFRIAEEVSNHCGMVFHRFISTGRIRIVIGSDPETGTACKPWDPMLESHPDIRPTPEERLEGGVRLRGFVLPRPDRFTSEKERDKAGGPEGWVAQQGMHVYRGDRLLLYGGWMGLRDGRKAWTRDPACQLARIRLEFPSTADAEWALDISKRHARIPDRYRTKVMTLVRYVREKAKTAWFGRPNGASPTGVGLWRQGFLPSDPWKLNREHPLLTEIRDRLGDASALLTDLVRLVEQGQPVATPMVGMTDAPPAATIPEAPVAREPKTTATPKEIELMKAMIRKFKERGLPKETAIQRTMAMEPYDTMGEEVKITCDGIYL